MSAGRRWYVVRQTFADMHRLLDSLALFTLFGSVVGWQIISIHKNRSA
jgi:hypothetical protein